MLIILVFACVIIIMLDIANHNTMQHNMIGCNKKYYDNDAATLCTIFILFICSIYFTAEGTAYEKWMLQKVFIILFHFILHVRMA